MADLKIGVLSCSGEECLGGTISRLATRKMLEELRPGQTVTLCLPLYLAGGEEERFFAKAFPVITVDGCSKCCAKRATEKYSGKVSDIVDVSEILGNDVALDKTVSTKDMTSQHMEMVDKVAKVICEKFDKIAENK
ncbi:DGC domain-containing protein [Caloramator quimbayensis]|uniref:DGC domain-containing protein n=1 Tax=Caloramator quimbayensis TaxID=1147123 RepID=A0A1T4WVJ4_9CLOT|nr:putative zinc-binding protein [Caloramator quimbayensis]SKA81147.1 DGC domain-containing protein [Caloramator quimbayensis]